MPSVHPIAATMLARAPRGDRVQNANARCVDDDQCQQEEFDRHVMLNPPSTTKVCPVM